MYSSIHDYSTMAQMDNQLTFKNNIVGNLTRAVQSVCLFLLLIRI
jgi:hypothetical protein